MKDDMYQAACAAWNAAAAVKAAARQELPWLHPVAIGASRAEAAALRAVQEAAYRLRRAQAAREGALS